MGSTAHPDATGAAGPADFAQFVNGGFAVYDKSSGSRTASVSDRQFWISAGTPVETLSAGVLHPRIVYDITAKEGLDELCERRGMTQIAVMSRLVCWLVAQDEVVQASVLGLLSQETLGDLSQALLKRMAAQATEASPGSRQPQAGAAGRSRTSTPASEPVNRLLDQ